MKLSHLVFRSMLKNMKHYYLYFFSLIFSVALYFSFKTLRYNGEITNQLKDSGMASTGFEVATYLLYFIILVFVLYANAIFIKRRSNEIGLYQLIGMTKGMVFRLIALENMILFSSAVVVGIVIGFATSRLFALILLKLIGGSFVLGVSFSWQAVVMTLMMFAVMLVIILVQQFIVIKRSSLLQMFKVANQSDETIRKFSWMHMILGLIGLFCIVYGYRASTVLFEGVGNDLLKRMMLVLFSTIFGTYLVFRYSVALILNLWRQKKAGLLSTSDIVALTPIMHRMKASSSSLTLIAVLTAVSLGINTLCYIAYYSVEKMSKDSIPADFISINEQYTDFKDSLDAENIEYELKTFKSAVVEADFKQLLANKSDEDSLTYDVLSNVRVLPASVTGEKLKDDEAVVKNFNGFTVSTIKFADQKMLTIPQGNLKVKVIRYDEKSLLSNGFGLTLYPVLLLSDENYKKISAATTVFESEHQFNLADSSQLDQANDLYMKSGANIRGELANGEYRYFASQNTLIVEQVQSLGLTIFITAFLGLAFLFASGSILYFKQMTEADQEQSTYTILRKIGFSEDELMKGIYVKQLFNYGVPIIVGLLHSYFAVKSGWWFFGTEFGIPMFIMMVIYVLLYMVFAIFTIRYYRMVIRRSF